MYPVQGYYSVCRYTVFMKLGSQERFFIIFPNLDSVKWIWFQEKFFYFYVTESKGIFEIDVDVFLRLLFLTR